MSKTYTVHDVLAGAYKRRDIERRPTLTHMSDDGGLTSLCRRVKPGHLADEGATPVGTEVTCARCLHLYVKAALGVYR